MFIFGILFIVCILASLVPAILVRRTEADLAKPMRTAMLVCYALFFILEIISLFVVAGTAVSIVAFVAALGSLIFGILGYVKREVPQNTGRAQRPDNTKYIKK